MVGDVVRAHVDVRGDGGLEEGGGPLHTRGDGGDSTYRGGGGRRWRRRREEEEEGGRRRRGRS